MCKGDPISWSHCSPDLIPVDLFFEAEEGRSSCERRQSVLLKSDVLKQFKRKSEASASYT